MTDKNDSPDLLVEMEGHTLIMTMNRPESRNALSRDMTSRLEDAYDEINGNPEVRCAILTGAGGNFCAGADLKMMNEKSTEKQFEEGGYDPAYVKSILKGFNLKKPLICAVEGFAIAGGTELLQASDIRVAGKSAKFGVAEVKMGLFPLGASTIRLPRQIPYTLAADMLLTGRVISADEALEFGLIGYVTEDGGALAKAKKLAEKVCRNGPVAVQAVLAAIRATDAIPEAEALKIEGAIGIEVFKSEDAKEGPRAFVEKRHPVYKGR